jgi:hypothetical protein
MLCKKRTETKVGRMSSALAVRRTMRGCDTYGLCCTALCHINDALDVLSDSFVFRPLHDRCSEIRSATSKPPCSVKTLHISNGRSYDSSKMVSIASECSRVETRLAAGASILIWPSPSFNLCFIQYNDRVRKTGEDGRKPKTNFCLLPG